LKTTAGVVLTLKKSDIFSREWQPASAVAFAEAVDSEIQTTGEAAAGLIRYASLESASLCQHFLVEKRNVGEANENQRRSN